jgi:hypothetical protein
MRSPHLPGETSTYLWLWLEREGEHWKFTEPPEYRPEAADNEIPKTVPLPPELVDELLALGTEWANMHPEAFERAARAEFVDLILYITQDTFEELARICSDAQSTSAGFSASRNSKTTPRLRSGAASRRRRNGCA